VLRSTGGISTKRLCEELPEYANRLRARFDEVRDRTVTLPFVLTYGDFNPNNLYEEPYRGAQIRVIERMEGIG